MLRDSSVATKEVQKVHVFIHIHLFICVIYLYPFLSISIYSFYFREEPHLNGKGDRSKAPATSWPSSRNMGNSINGGSTKWLVYHGKFHENG